jgi:hypothetical protein
VSLGAARRLPFVSMTSQLEFRKWSVISERGREVSSVSYEEARRLVHKLAGEGRHGLCIISDQAASLIEEADPAANERELPTPL